MKGESAGVRLDQLSIVALFLGAGYWVMFPLIRLLDGTKLWFIASDSAQWAAALLPIATVTISLARRHIRGRLRTAPLLVLSIGVSVIVLARWGPESRSDSEALAIVIGVLIMAAAYLAQVFLAVKDQTTPLGQRADGTAATSWLHRVWPRGVR